MTRAPLQVLGWAASVTPRGVWFPEGTHPRVSGNLARTPGRRLGISPTLRTCRGASSSVAGIACVARAGCPDLSTRDPGLGSTLVSTFSFE